MTAGRLPKGTELRVIGKARPTQYAPQTYSVMAWRPAGQDAQVGQPVGFVHRSGTGWVVRALDGTLVVSASCLQADTRRSALVAAEGSDKWPDSTLETLTGTRPAYGPGSPTDDTATAAWEEHPVSIGTMPPSTAEARANVRAALQEVRDASGDLLMRWAPSEVMRRQAITARDWEQLAVHADALALILTRMAALARAAARELR